MAGQSDTVQQQDTLNRYLLYFPRSKTVSPSLMIRVFYRPNTGCICRQNRLMIREFCRADRGFNIV